MTVHRVASAEKERIRRILPDDPIGDPGAFAPISYRPRPFWLEFIQSWAFWLVITIVFAAFIIAAWV